MLATSPIREPHKSPLYSLPQLKFQRSSSAQLLLHVPSPHTPQLKPLPFNIPIKDSPVYATDPPPLSPKKSPPQKTFLQQEHITLHPQPLPQQAHSPPQLRRIISTNQLVGNGKSNPPQAQQGLVQQSSPQLKRLSASTPQIRLPQTQSTNQLHYTGGYDNDDSELYPFDLPDKEQPTVTVSQQKQAFKLVASLSFKEPDSIVHRVKGLSLEKLIEKIIYFEGKEMLVLLFLPLLQTQTYNRTP